MTMERKIEEIFEYKDKKLKVVEKGSSKCKKCFFHVRECLSSKDVRGFCLKEYRTDKKSVIFVEVKDEQPQEQAEQPQKLNLCEVLKHCPQGETLWSPMLGYVKMYEIDQEAKTVDVELENGDTWDINADGTITFGNVTSQEIILYPSKEQRDWNKVKYEPKKERFDPKKLKAFDRVIVYGKNEGWFCSIFSHIGEGEYPYNTASGNYAWCIPYNDETRYLVGTKEEAPVFYRYWED